MNCESQALVAITGTENLPVSVKQKLPILWSDCLWATKISRPAGRKGVCYSGRKDFVIGAGLGLAAISHVGETYR